MIFAEACQQDLHQSTRKRRPIGATDDTFKKINATGPMGNWLLKTRFRRHCQRQRSNPPTNQGILVQSAYKALDLSRAVFGVPFLVWIASLTNAMTCINRSVQQLPEL
jgi:hypothetical protein